MDLAPGERTTVTRVPDADPGLLRYLGELALVPGGAVELASLAPFDGPARVRSASGEHAISRRVAATIGVA